jgi:hypothetical protein
MALDIQRPFWIDAYSWIVEIKLEKKMATCISHSATCCSCIYGQFKMAADAMFKQPKQLLLVMHKQIKLI